MASADTNRLLESPTSIQASINQRLAEDGIEEDCSDEEKLIYIWRLYQKTEEALALAKDAEQKLKQGQAEEMQEVENYVEHIRHLSDEREALIQELEAENDTLKSEIEELRQGEASATLRKETAEMLVQQGLDEIANANSSEQIAFLLVERARLLDELESADRSTAHSDGGGAGAQASDGRDSAELKEILNRERTEFEEELQQQRESSRLMTESMRQEHEEEISALMEENQRLEEDFNTQKEKVRTLEEELEKEQVLREKERTAWQTENDELRTMVNTLRHQLEEAKADRDKESKERESPRTPVQGRPPSPLSRTPSDVALTKVIAEKTKIEAEILPLKTQLRKLEAESSEKDGKMTQLRTEVEQAVMKLQQMQMKNKTLKDDMDEMEQQLDEAETEAEKLKRERDNMQEKLTALQEEVKALRSDAAKGSTLQDVVDILKNDKQSLMEQVEELQRELRDEKRSAETLQAERLSLTQSEFDLGNELREVKEMMESLKTEKELLALEKEGLTDSQRDQAETMRSLRGEVEELKSGKLEAESRGEKLDKENKELRNSLAKLESDLDSAKTMSQTLAQHEITVKHMRDQNQKLNTELAELKSQVEYLRQEKHVLEEKQSAQKSTHEEAEKKYKEEVKDLREKLQLTLTELTKVKATLEQEKTEKSALNERLQASKGEEAELMERLKTEKAALQVKVRDLESQLADMKEAADSFEEERDQRLDLERKLSTLTEANESLSRTKDRLELENRARQSQDSQLREFGRVKEELSTAQEELEKEQRAKKSWEVKAADLQQSLEDLRLDSEGVQQSLNAKVKSLEKRVTTLQEDLFAAQDELQMQQDRCVQIEKEKEKLMAVMMEKEEDSEKEVMEMKEKYELEISELFEKLELVEREAEEKLEASRKEWEETLARRGVAVSGSDDRDGGPTETHLAAATTRSSGFGDEEMDGTVSNSASSESLQRGIAIAKVTVDTASQTEGANIDGVMETKSQSPQKAKAVHSAACQTDVETQAPKPKTVAKASRSVASQTDAVTQNLKLKAGAGNPTEVEEVPVSEEIVKTTQVGLATTPRKQLEDTLKMLDLSKSRETQLLTDLEISGRNIEQTRKLLEQTTLRLEECEHEKMSASKSLAEKQTTVELLKMELEEARRRAEELREDKRELQRDLDSVQAVVATYPAEERQQHMDRIATLERQLQALELDHREVSRKLLDTTTKLDMAEDSLQREKLRNSDKLQRSSQYVRQLEDDLDAANKQIRTLREELHHQQTAVFKLEADNAGQMAKYESQISRLESEIKDLKTHHKREQENWHSRIEEAHAEARELRNVVRNKEQDVMERMQELSKANATVERLQQQLRNETQLRVDYENRNKTLDQEMTKVWSQVRSLMEKNADLESTKRSVEEDLERNLTSTKALETSYKQRITNEESALKAAVSRAENAERKESPLPSTPPPQEVESLQRELDGVRSQLSGMDHQLQKAETSKYELQEKSDAIVHIRNQLEGEKLQRTLLDQTVSELKHQTSLLKQREAKVADENRQLQHTILDLESRLGSLQDSSDSTIERQRQLNEVGKKSMADQIARLQKEMKQLQYELLAASEKREMDERRYEDRKRRTKVKLMKAREVYTTQKSFLQEQMERMDEDLRLTRATLRKELEWKEKMDTNYKHLLQEKRELITRLTEQDEAIRDQARTLAMLQVRCKYLEEENLRQQDHIDSLTRQHQCLDKYGKEVEDGGGESVEGMTGVTSGLGTSMASSWDPDRQNDPGISVSNGLRQGRGAYSGHVIDLYASPEMETNFGDEFEA